MTREEQWYLTTLCALAFGGLLALALFDAPQWTVMLVVAAIAWPLRRPLCRLTRVLSRHTSALNDAIGGFVEWFVRGVD